MRPSEEQISLLRQVLELETDLTESHEFLELLQMDLFNDQVFVFTPDGDVIDLPAGAGPIDFAYRIHTEIGHHAWARASMATGAAELRVAQR
jgi:guanosine-3',5'-bis(diphosphate) 3'-pyrophosphohydrolase